MKKTLAITLLAICGGVTLGTAIEASPVITETKADFNELKHDALLALDNTFMQIEREKDLYLINFDKISSAYVEGIEAIQDATTAEEVNSALSHYRSLMVSFPPDDVIVDTFGDEINEISRFLTIDLDIKAFIYSAVDLANRVKPIYEEFNEDVPGLTLLWEKVSFMEACVNGYSSLLELQATVEEYSVSAEVKTNVSNFIYGTAIDYYENNFGSLTVESEFEQFKADIKIIAKSVFDNLENLNNLPELITTGFETLDNTNEFSAYLDNLKSVYEDCTSGVVVSKEITDNYNLLVESYGYYVELCNYVTNHSEGLSTDQKSSLNTILESARTQFRSKSLNASEIYSDTLSSLQSLVELYTSEQTFEAYKNSHFKEEYKSYESYVDRIDVIAGNFYDNINDSDPKEHSFLVGLYCGKIDEVNNLFDLATELNSILVEIQTFEFTETYKAKLDRCKEINDLLPADIFKDVVGSNYEIVDIVDEKYDVLAGLWLSYIDKMLGISDIMDEQLEIMFEDAIKIAQTGTYDELSKFTADVRQRFYYMSIFQRERVDNVDKDLINQDERYKEALDEVLEEIFTAYRTCDPTELLPTDAGCRDKLTNFIKDLRKIEDLKSQIKNLKDFEFTLDTKYGYQGFLSTYDSSDDFVKEMIGEDVNYVYLVKQAYEGLSNIEDVYYNWYVYMSQDQMNHYHDLFNALINTLHDMIQDKENLDSVIESGTIEITEYFEYCKELNEAKVQLKDYIFGTAQNAPGMYLIDDKEGVVQGWLDRIANATSILELDSIRSEVTTTMNRAEALYKIDLLLSEFEFDKDSELIKDKLAEWKSCLAVVSKKSDCLAVYEGAREEIIDLYQEAAKQKIEDYLAGLDQSFWTDSMKDKTESGKNSYFSKIDKEETRSGIDSLVKEAIRKLGKFPKPEVREEKGCNKGTGAIVIISIVVVVGVILTICLTSGKKGKKETKKTKK